MDHSLRDVLMPISVIGSLATGTFFFTKTLTDYILKKKMIEKGFVNEDTQAIFKQQQNLESKFPSLKWGLIIFFIGLSLIVMEYVPTSPESPLPYGLVAVSTSLGFLIYYFIVKNEAK